MMLLAFEGARVRGCEGAIGSFVSNPPPCWFHPKSTSCGAPSLIWEDAGSQIFSANFSTRLRKRCTPATASGFRFLLASTGHINIVYTLSVSLPYSCTISIGSITLPRRFDILRPSDACTMP